MEVDCHQDHPSDADNNNGERKARILGSKVWENVQLSVQQQNTILMYHEQYGISINRWRRI